MRKEIHFVSAEEAVKVIKSGDHIHLSSVASTPQILVDALCKRGETGEAGEPHCGVQIGKGEEKLWNPVVGRREKKV